MKKITAATAANEKAIRKMAFVTPAKMTNKITAIMIQIIVSINIFTSRT